MKVSTTRINSTRKAIEIARGKAECYFNRFTQFTHAITR